MAAMGSGRERLLMAITTPPATSAVGPIASHTPTVSQPS